MEYLACAEPLRRAGLSVAAETLLVVSALFFCSYSTWGQDPQNTKRLVVIEGFLKAGRTSCNQWSQGTKRKTKQCLKL